MKSGGLCKPAVITPQPTQTISAPTNPLRDAQRQTLAEARDSEKRKAKLFADQCKGAQLIPCQLYPPTTVIWDEEGRRIGEPYVSPAPPTYGTPVSEGQSVEQRVPRTRSWTLP